ncbi:hypothetical protein [Aestuariibaculum lutulentum]|uniref:Uncharacterized protein n=1 Tax=Aestuariibaculum lutulentum TaxID=2920935 RepID=A0ABS9RMW7_9FLAO|nr:hypothetical protein [Aestuariibaculum lutulentum]MCH4553901.1 hypothetical protein [Aestuariibaculum lutulentum]
MINAELFEELGFKTAKLGYFKEWQDLAVQLSKEKKLSLCNSGEIVLDTLIKNHTKCK